MSRCWAYNQDKVRCNQDAGHDGLHMISVTWRDDECYEPHTTVHSLVTVTEAAPILPSLPEPMPQTTGCVGCGHQHKGGPCKCGCYESIG